MADLLLSIMAADSTVPSTGKGNESDVVAYCESLVGSEHQAITYLRALLNV